MMKSERKTHFSVYFRFIISSDGSEDAPKSASHDQIPLRKVRFSAAC